ncbi:MAG: sigma-70 family RNA polymerase sigma factor [Planctomycetales bacterium]|nr:sigma-70 family RNA polymerase sigma factor [Planctomycetales bacterium]
MNQSRDDQYNEFVSLLGHCENRIRRFVRSLMIRGVEIDDVMQDVSLECWRKFESFSPACDESSNDEFVRWACVIARFKVLSRIRDASRERLVFRDELYDLLADQVLADQASHVTAKHLAHQRALESCLDRLPEDDRRLLLSVHVPGDSVAEIARQTGAKARRLYNRINALRGLMLDCVRSRLASE